MFHSPYAIGRLVVHEMDRQNLSKADIVRRLGYMNIQKGMRRLERLMETGFEVSILPRLATALGIFQRGIDEALAETDAEIAIESEDARKRADDYERANFRPYILIESDSRIGKPTLFGRLVYEKLKHIPIAPNVGPLLAEQITSISRVVQEHYVNASGSLETFGAITGYVYRRTFDDSVRFDTDGRVVNYFEPRPVEVRPRLGMKRRSPITPSRMSAPWSGGCNGFDTLSLSEGDNHVAP